MPDYTPIIDTVDPTAPLRLSFIHERPTPLGGVSPGEVHDGNRLQVANALGNLRRQRGRSMTSANDPNMGPSPMQRAVSTAKLLSQAPQEDDSQPADPGPDPNSPVGPGQMSISQGTGPGAMSAEDINQWRQNAQQYMPGSNPTPNGVGYDVNSNGKQAGFTATLGTQQPANKPQVPQSDPKQAKADATEQRQQMDHLRTASALARQQASSLDKNGIYAASDPKDMANDPSYQQWQQAQQDAQDMEQQYVQQVKSTLGKKSSDNDSESADIKGLQPAVKPGSKGKLGMDAAHQYLDRVGGDPAKARAAAKADGWTF